MIEHLPKEVSAHQKGSVARVDRVSLMRHLINHQKLLLSEAANAQKRLLDELKPEPIYPALMREPTRAEIASFDKAESERLDALCRAEHFETYGRRQAMLEDLAGLLGVRQTDSLVAPLQGQNSAARLPEGRRQRRVASGRSCYADHWSLVVGALKLSSHF
jgi:hypothetical protein